MPSIQFWLLRAVSNLHAGSGDADFGIIDKHVQRDPVTGLPTINASSIKGAFREIMENELPATSVERIFGNENSAAGSQNPKPGEYRFYSAKTLALPVRSSEDFYYIATCPELLEDWIQDMKLYGAVLPEGLEATITRLKAAPPEAGKPHRYGGSQKTTRLEDNGSVRKGDTCGLEHWLGARVAILHASDFQVLSNELPVIARNHLENGTSVNLWYEQVVPRESRFYCPIRESDTELGDMLISPQMGGLIQIGGNATVGYGLTHFSKI